MNYLDSKNSVLDVENHPEYDISLFETVNHLFIKLYTVVRLSSMTTTKAVCTHSAIEGN